MKVDLSGLQSKKLHKALADPRFVPTVEDNVDMLVCGKYRPILEQEFDVRFAPEQVADRFSYELLLPVAPTCGFHGLAICAGTSMTTKCSSLLSLLILTSCAYRNSLF
jgi:hypothetical protein